jgi:hypothetical protein
MILWIYRANAASETKRSEVELRQARSTQIRNSEITCQQDDFPGNVFIGRMLRARRSEAKSSCGRRAALKLEIAKLPASRMIFRGMFL